MNDVVFTFDEMLTMKALKFKADIAGHGNNAFLSHLVEGDPEQAEALGMKNMCFRVHPYLQARLEATLSAIGMTKQEALTEAVQEMLNRVDAKLEAIGLGPISFDQRLAQLGYELTPPGDDGTQRIVRISKES